MESARHDTVLLALPAQLIPNSHATWEFSLSTCVPALRAPDLQFGVHLGSQEAILPIVHPAKQWKR